MKICRFSFTLALFLLFASARGQSVILKGSGLGYRNARLRIYSLIDPVTKRLKPLSDITCDENGAFSCTIPCRGTENIFIKTGIYKLHLYLREGSEYQLLLPEYIAKPAGEEQNPFYIETEAIPEVVNNQQDPNNLIRTFDMEYNLVFNLVADHVFKNYRVAEIEKEVAKLDKFTITGDRSFYSDYVECRMIMLHLVYSSGVQNQKSAADFLNRSYNSENQAFHDLGEQMYSKYFISLSAGPLKESFNKAIYLASLTELRGVIRQDNRIINKELADFVILLNLNNGYYERSLPGNNVRKIIIQMKTMGETGFIRNTATEMSDRIESTLPGNLPHDFLLASYNGRKMSLKDFNGKLLLLGFARADNPGSMMELGIINMWQKKYADDLHVVTVLTDKNFANSCETFLKKGFNWTFLDGSSREELEYSFDLRIYPTFILIGRDGKIIAYPCSYPSEDLEMTIRKILTSETSK
jgi:peroxiredoxin